MGLVVDKILGDVLMHEHSVSSIVDISTTYLKLDQSTPQTTTGTFTFPIVHTPTINGGILANDDITIQGTTHATRTTSYVILQPSGGNVGIGTTSPGSKLQVVGSDSLNTSFAGNISGATGTGLVITNAGNVGIGTTGPGAKLEINTGAIGTIGQLIKGYSGQTANLSEWQSSNGDKLALVDSTGKIRTGLVGTGVSTHQLEVQAGHLNFVTIPNVSAASIGLALAGVPGNVDNGDHKYAVTFVTPYGETGSWPRSSTITVVDKTSNGQINLTNIPISSDVSVTQRKIYRSKGTGNPDLLFLLTTINNNTSTTYVDNVADSSLGTNAPAFNNTTAGNIYIDNTRVLSFADNTIGLGRDTGMNGPNMTGVGYHALYRADGAFAAGATAIGYGAIANQVNPYLATAVGYNAGAVASFSTTSIGANSGGRNYATIIGYGAGTATTDSSTMIGLGAGAASAGSGHVFLGQYAGYYETGSNKLFIDNVTRASESDGRVKALIYGIFDAAVANQYLTINGQLQVTGTGNSYISGNVGIGTTAPNRILGIGGLVARNIGMERGTVAATAGFALTINAGGATSGSTDKAGGDLYLTSGVGTGTGTSNVYLQVNPAGSTGTTDTTPTTVLSLLGASGFVWNDGGLATQDMRVESDNYDALFIDSSNDSIMVMGNTAGKVGFYGVTAVAQQVFATGAGHTVDELITMLQTLGICKQS